MKNKHLLLGFALIAIGAIGLFATSASAISFKIENGLTDVGVTPLADAQSASDYYNYTPATFSGHPSFGTEANTGFMWLYEDTNSGDLSLGMIFGKHQPELGKTPGGSASFSISGLMPGAFLDVKDDPDPLDPNYDISGDVWNMSFSWQARYTDGAVIGGLNAFSLNDEITMTLNSSRGIDDWYFLTGDPVHPDGILLDMSDPLVIYDPPAPTPPGTATLFCWVPD